MELNYAEEKWQYVPKQEGTYYVGTTNKNYAVNSIPLAVHFDTRDPKCSITSSPSKIVEGNEGTMVIACDEKISLASSKVKVSGGKNLKANLISCSSEPDSNGKYNCNVKLTAKTGNFLGGIVFNVNVELRDLAGNVDEVNKKVNWKSS